MPAWIHKHRASFLSSTFYAFSYSNSLFNASSHSLSVKFPQSERNVYEPSLTLWPKPPCPTSPSPDVFFSNLLSLCQSKIGHPLTSPTAPPDNLLPLPLAWLNPGCQSAVLCCALHAPVRCRLVTGYLGFTHCCCACLFICSLFHGFFKAVSPPPYPFPPFSSPSPFSSTHSTILPLPPPLLPYLLLIPSS